MSLNKHKEGLKFLILTIAKPFYKIFTKIFPKQQNLFAFYIPKPKIPEDLHPWLTFNHELKIIKFDKLWGENVYKKNHPSDN